MKLTESELSRLALAIESNNWSYVKGFATSMILVHGTGIMKKYGSAVTRIETEFQRLFRASPWPNSYTFNQVLEHRIKLGSIVSSFGNVAPLIDDLHQVKMDGKSVRDLTYFMFAKGRAGRWDMLLSRHFEEKWAEFKRQEQSTFTRSSAKSPVELRIAYDTVKTAPAPEVALGTLFGSLLAKTGGSK